MSAPPKVVGRFARTLDTRAQELAELAALMQQADDMEEAAECVRDAVDNLHAAAKWLRDPVRDG